MKKTDWDYEHDRMIIETGHKAFDAQTNLLADGNLLANTMSGSHIRAWNDTSHWKEGEKNDPGHLFAFDMDWRFNYFLPRYKRIYTQIKDLAMDNPVWVYIFYHHNRKGKPVIHGVVVSDGKTHNHLRTFVTGPTYKSYNVVYAAREYVCNMQEEAK